MKKFTLALLCLGALCAIPGNNCYINWSSDMINARETLYRGLYKWLLEIDSIYVDGFIMFKEDFENILSDLGGAFINIKTSFETIRHDHLSEDLSNNITEFFELINSTFSSPALTDVPSFSNSLGHGIELSVGLSSVIMNVETKFRNDLISILLEFPDYKSISEECKTWMLLNFNSFHESFKQEIKSILNVKTQYVGNLFTGAHYTATLLIKETDELKNKLQKCQNEPESNLNQCLQEIVDEYYCYYCSYKGKLNNIGPKISKIEANFKEGMFGGIDYPFTNYFEVGPFLKLQCP